jgi:hypothetical protein
VKYLDRQYWVCARMDGFDGIHTKMRWWRANYAKRRGRNYYFKLKWVWPPKVAHKNKHGWCKTVRSPFARTRQ